MTSASADEVAEIVPELVEEEQGVLVLDDADLLDGVGDEPAPRTADEAAPAGSGVLAGAAAVAAAALGLVSL
ncbi:MAG: hypothetical protein HOV83_20400, partial [Catenulispora sp.]|nr:hypothetical protein [Catenulispora sp.]